MQFNVYADVHGFYADTYAVLMGRESQNMILLGNIMIGKEGKDKTGWRDPASWLMATVTDGGTILLTALMTPPHHITLYATDNVVHPDAIKCLVDGLRNYTIPGVTTDKVLAEAFATEYIATKGLSFEITMSQRIYELAAVNTEIKQFGTIRLLEERDMCFFPYWLEAFYAGNVYEKREMSIPQNEEFYRYQIASEKIYVLEVDGVPVSMAGYTRKMQTMVGVAYVYTPPYYRRNGYATSCVAQLSQRALNKGIAKCVLYTDLLNPTSNSIYQNIGYTPICDSLMLKFV